MRFTSLGSGSDGNSLVVEEDNTRLLLDCGFTLKEITQRLNQRGINPADLTAILVTHEHDDHAGGVFKLANRFKVPVWLTHGTFEMIKRFLPNESEFKIQIIDSHSPFNIQALEIHPYPVPHDAREPVQFVFHNGDRRLGVLTDTGRSTKHIETMLSGCHALVLECNHDLEMLMNGKYAWPLKKRISGSLGHLDNQSSAEILKNIDCSKLQHIVAAHLSAQNNTPNLAQYALSQALNTTPEFIQIANQTLGIDWRVIQ